MVRLCSFTLALVVSACVGAPSATPAAPAQSSETSARDELETYADDLMERARALEPSVTPLLQRMANEAGGRMLGLEHRFKKRTSLLRKLRLHSSRNPGKSIRDIHIDDALRYTIEIADQPEGRYNESVSRILSALESQGHVVKKVKNYWPRGDNYSGVNTVIAAPVLDWELQFHTPQSAAEQKGSHALYEELRRRDTPIERKREVFDEMTRPWNSVPIPRGVLEPRSLHATEEIIQRPRP